MSLSLKRYSILIALTVHEFKTIRTQSFLLVHFQNALEVGIELVRHLPEPFDEQTSEKLNEIADCLNLLAEFVITEARYARILYSYQNKLS